MVKETTTETDAELLAKFCTSRTQTQLMYLGNYGMPPAVNDDSQKLKLATKIRDEYELVKKLPPPQAVPRKKKEETVTATEIVSPTAKKSKSNGGAAVAVAKAPVGVAPEAKEAMEEQGEATADLIDAAAEAAPTDKTKGSSAVVAYQGGVLDRSDPRTTLLLRHRERLRLKPEWHAPWKLMRVISGHLGWVRCMAVDPSNEWFATGAADRCIKIWDMASGTLKLTLTGHISAVRGLAISERSPYLFSVGEDKLVKCWDLEYNKIIRNYHGHLSGVYTCQLHPTLDVLLTGGRDASCRVWDIRTKANVRVLGGHTSTIAAIGTQQFDPQVVTASHDTTIRTWDLAEGRTMSTLTNHKKSVRALGIHPKEYTFYSGGADNIKVWKCPKGNFLRNISGHNAIINDMCINQDNVLVSAADNGTMNFWDWKTGYNFQSLTAKPQPGSLDSENGIFACTFDKSGSRLITAEADKTIKIYKEDEEATPETHPINYKPPKKRSRY